MYCKKCGNKLNPSDDFCPKCGNKVQSKKLNLEGNNDNTANSGQYYIPRPALLVVIFLMIILVFVIIYTISIKREKKHLNDYSLIANKWVFNNQEYDIEVQDVLFKGISPYDSYNISNLSDFVSEFNLNIPDNETFYILATEQYSLNRSAEKNYNEKGIYFLFADQDLTNVDSTTRDYNHVYDYLVVTNISENTMTVKNSRGQSFVLLKSNDG